MYSSVFGQTGLYLWLFPFDGMSPWMFVEKQVMSVHV